jgi:uroporphyrinogen-III synthase
VHILVTRPQHQANSTAEALKQIGHSSLVEPMLEIQLLETRMPAGPFSGMILTSSNSASGLEKLDPERKLAHLPVLTTGKASAEATRHRGFANVDHVSGSALDLVDHIPDWIQQKALEGKLLYPCAETTAHDLSALLAHKHISCHSWPIYRMIPANNFSTAARQALTSKKIDGILLYSKRTAHTFVQLMQQNEISMKGLHAYVMSHDIYNSLPEDLQTHAHYPSKPSETDLLNLIAR